MLQSRGQVTKALEEDPSVFEYDSIYDQMQEKKRKSDPRLVTKDKNVRVMHCHGEKINSCVLSNTTAHAFLEISDHNKKVS